MRRFLVVIEKANKNYSAYSPDLHGCIASGKTIEETEQNMQTAIEMHIRGMIEDRQRIPRTSAISEYIAVAV
ncbi:MAG: type II toxin-antitoxin system HicB family antitoxin [Candidatus Edwardsbacteria bacterium]|nr:type II toxin-antitoxin system HicB family antitoxin [Candidatus Edwardsbacteria bacterium]